MQDKKKVILFYAMFEDDAQYQYIPWTTIYLAAYLEKYGYETICIDEFCDRNYEETIKKHAPDSCFFGVSGMTGRQTLEGINAIKTFKKYNSTAPIGYGGAHASAVPEETLEHELIDYVFVGQTFMSLPELLDDIRSGKITSHNKVIRATYPTAEDFDEFPSFNLENIDFSPYIVPENRLLNYSASIGCPATCSFCSWGDKHSHRYFSVKRMVHDIKHLVTKYDLTTLLIQDATFCANKDTVLEFADEMIAQDVNCFWRCDGRVPELAKFSKQEFHLLENSGLDWIFVGIESTVPRIMKIMHKRYPNEMVDQVLENLKDTNIILFMSLILGSPTETIEEMEDNFAIVSKWIEGYKNVMCQKCIFTPYPGVPLTEMAAKEGFKLPTSIEEWSTHPLFIDTNRSLQNCRTWMTKDFEERYPDIIANYYPERSHNRTLKPAGTKPKIDKNFRLSSLKSQLVSA